MLVAFLGDPSPWPECWRGEGSRFIALPGPPEPDPPEGPAWAPDLVVVEGPGSAGFLTLLDRLRSRLAPRKVRFAGWSAEPSPLEVFVCHNASLPLLHPAIARDSPDLGALVASLSSAREPYPGSAEPPPSIDSPAIALGLYRSLSRAFGARSDPAALCGHLHDALALLGDPEILVFMLHGRPRGEIRIFAGPGISRSDCDYFLQFCRQDFLDTDRFIDLKAMDIRYPNFEEGRVAAGRGISSYWHCPLEDAEGRPIGTIHLGNSGNRYFTPLIATSFEELTGKAGALIASMRRDLALTVRLRSLRSLFGKFLPEAVIERLLSDDREGRLDEGRRQELAILFSDIRSFTTITERNGAEAVVQFLNHHFDAMVAPITANGGTVDKFIGDAIVAVFGMEEGGPPPCEAALRAAVAMIEAIPRVELQGLSLEGGRYRIGIGVHFGELVLGYLGSEAKTAFTVIGKTIEIAEGLESSTKAFKVDILLSEEVRSRVNSDDLVFRDLGLVEAEEGEGLHVYTVQGSAGGPRP